LFWEKNRMIKTIKTTLFATAALSAVTTFAQADALADLKSVIAQLNTRDAASQSAVQVPRGFKVSPTADASVAADAVEEPFIDVKTSGYLKTGFIISDYATSSVLKTATHSKLDFDAEAGVNVKGSVQSTLGEVGVTVQAKWNLDPNVNNGVKNFALRDEGIIGFWQFLPTMKFETGRGNGGRMENGIDKNTRRLFTFANRRVRSENAGNGFFDRDMYNAFMGLTYAEGPFTLQLRGHDATRGIGGGGVNSDANALGGSVKAVYAGDVIGFEASGGYWGQDTASNLGVTSQTGVKWLAGVGTELNFIEGVPLSIAGQMGELHNGTQMLDIYGSAGFTLTDTINAGVGAGWKRISNMPVGTAVNTQFENHEELAVVGGVYYSPMTYLTLGLEGDWLSDNRPAMAQGLTGAFVSRLSF
jgi:hypothetical protein